MVIDKNDTVVNENDMVVGLFDVNLNINDDEEEEAE